MTFGEALNDIVVNGKHARRELWSPEDQLWLEKQTIPPGKPPQYPQLWVRMPDGTFAVYRPTHIDLLATDWLVLNPA